MTAQVTLSHRQKTAYVYVRQSTMGQVRNHQESTERQYALKDKAISLGWPATSMHILDGDLGISGATQQRPRRFQEVGGRGLPGRGGGRVRPGGIAPGAVQRRLAPSDRDLCPDRHADHRRGRLLRSGGFQRRPPAWDEGPDVSGRTAFPPRSASRAASSIKPRKASCVSRCRLGCATMTPTRSCWTLTPKCAGRWNCCLRPSEKQAAGMPWPRHSQRGG